LKCRLEFSREIIQRQGDDANFMDKIIWSDESTFHLNGTVNKRNDIEWHVENPHRQRVNLMRSEGMCVWAAVSSNGFIGPYFFLQPENRQLIPETVTGDRYLKMLQDYFYPRFLEIENHEEYVFQQDGATPHYKNTVRNWLDETFGNRWIGRGTRLEGSINWPPRSCDLTPLDFWLWGVVKNKVYKTIPANLAELRDRISHVFGEITIDECRRSCRNVLKRVHKCVELNGRQISKDLLDENI